MPTEAYSCRTYVLPRLCRAGWTNNQIHDQVSFAPGQIIVADATVLRGEVGI